MEFTRKRRRLLAIVATALGLGWIITSLLIHQNVSSQNDLRIPFAVLGDSDSHSFHDSILLSDPAIRGAHFRHVTYQWTEVIALLRSTQIDMGDWGDWGLPGRLASLAGRLGLEDRAPRKQDYQFNFALSGAKCSGLTEGMSRQTQRLLYVMNQSPARWANGVITIRIGINNLGTLEAMSRFASNGLGKETAAEAAECAGYIRTAVSLIRAQHPETKIILVGVLNNADWVPWLTKWQTHAELQNITAVLDVFDSALRNIAASDSNIYFWDDRAWFTRRWGQRNSEGKPNYNDIVLNGKKFSYSQGDDPTNAILADGHAGTIWNGLWAGDLLAALNKQFGYSFKPIEESEVARLVEPDGSQGGSSE